MSANAMSAHDPYYWQDIHVLKNRLNIREAQRLAEAEAALTTLRLAQLPLGPLQPGLPHLCSIHRMLFQDLYDWAGKMRQVDLYLDDTPFCHFEYLEKQGNTLMRQLAEEGYLAGLPTEKLAARLAHYYCELNMLHPFRVGNGRALRIFVEQLLIHRGYQVDWAPIAPSDWIAANRAGASGDLSGLTALFRKVVSALESA